MDTKFDERGFEGTIYFYKDVKHGVLIASHFDSLTRNSDYIFLGQTEVCVTFDVDARQLEIDSIEKEMGKLKAETEHQLNIMRGRIQELQALTHD